MKETTRKGHKKSKEVVEQGSEVNNRTLSLPGGKESISRGGARIGAGRKQKSNKAKNYSVSLYHEEWANILSEYPTLTIAVRKLAETIKNKNI